MTAGERDSPTADAARLRTAYAAARLPAVRRGAIAYCLVAGTLQLATATLDPTRFPAVAGRLLAARGMGTVVLGAALGLLATRFGRRHPHSLALAVATAVGATLRAQDLIVGGDATPFDISANFAMLGVAFMIPWSPAWTAIACLHIIGVHLATVVAGVPFGIGFRQDLFVFGAAAVVSVCITAMLDRSRWADFVQRRVLADAHREAQAAADRYRFAVEAQRESQTLLRNVIDNSPVILFAVDRAHRVTFSGGRGLARIGFTADSFVGTLIEDVLQQGFPHASDHFARAFAGEEISFQGTLGGASFITQLTPIREPGGGVAGVIGLATDVTDRKAAEDARLALERRLLETQRLESLGLLAGGIAHDFNNLLTTVLGNASIALAELAGDAPARLNVERIEQAAHHGADLTRQLLAYAGEEQVALEPVDLNAIARETRDLLEVSLPERVALELALDRELPLVRADPTQIRQVLMNLVLNAGEAIGDAGTIVLRTRRVELDAAALRATRHAPDAVPGEHLVVEVVDDGCGMDAATAAKIFDPFFSTKRAGRGLGLASALGMVRGHRGALGVESTPGRGTTFRVFLPSEVTMASHTAAPPPVVPTATAPRVPRTVLLVDDEEDVRAVTAHMLERLGCAVLVAGDGAEGVRVFRTNAELIDAVVIDLTLPRLNGDQAAQEMRRIRPGAPVILMSGRSEESLRNRMATEDAVGFLRKPFSTADLRSMMESVLPESED